MWFQILKIDPKLRNELAALKEAERAGLEKPGYSERILEIETEIRGGAIASAGKLIPSTPVVPKGDEALYAVMEAAAENIEREKTVPESGKLDELITSMNKLTPEEQQKINTEHPRFRQMLLETKGRVPTAGTSQRIKGPSEPLKPQSSPKPPFFVRPIPNPVKTARTGYEYVRGKLARKSEEFLKGDYMWFQILKVVAAEEFLGRHKTAGAEGPLEEERIAGNIPISPKKREATQVEQGEPPTPPDVIEIEERRHKEKYPMA